LQPLFETILREIPAPRVDLDAPFQMLVTNIRYDDYLGVTAIGRISAGHVHDGQRLARIQVNGGIVYEHAKYLHVYQGLDRVQVDQADAGDIVAIAGLTDIAIGETLADAETPIALPPIHVEEPTVRMTFGVNKSPLAGKEGKWGTSRKLRERLFDELRNNVALRVEETDDADTFMVSGRGELHLAILIETMRREGYEFQVSRPEAIFIRGEDGELLEPYEEVEIDTSPETVGSVVEMLGLRRGQMSNMTNNPDGTVHLRYIIPTRGLLGFRYQFLTATRGTGILNTFFHGYMQLAPAISSRANSSIVAWETGVATTYGLKNAEERGILFIDAGTEVYEGMVVGETPKANEITVNVCKKKHLTNMRQANKDIEIRLKTPRGMSLDEAIEYLAEDELLEVTPLSFRIRKRVLNTEERGRIEKRAKEVLA
jgi:GTP-binding protein